ncbi:Alpha-D-kanosaminyltransferase [Palleronia abyssalis]|uniref:Alpha-D-kanosaminyltransferase n=1 Tax=Palleronia abyssalis TaxID=1501240 RepID=A0A2R8BTN4_9RHOB|nr:Alpha-D-kanosaminyltransferase [Palleronia abyssalis]
MRGLDALRRTQPLAGRRILILVENLPVPFDRRVWQESLTLAAAGAKVSVICPTGPGCEAEEETRDGIHIHRHPLPTEADGALGYAREYAAALWHQGRLAWKIHRTRGFDTIQACNPPDLLFLVALPFILFHKVRFVFDHHDISPELFEAKFGRRGPLWRLMLWLERATFGLADVVISTNESYRRIALDRGCKPPGRVHVVRSGPDLDRLRPVPPDPSWRNGRAYMVGYVGVMGQQEGIDLLLDAAARIVRAGHDVQFVLVGGGPALPGMRALAAKMGLADHVTFTGRAPDAALFSVLSTADICVNPDRVTVMNDKSTMNKILEYMAFSKPIVQFDVIEGRVSAGNASLYARPDDTADMARLIVDLLHDPSRRDAMGRAGRRRLEAQFDWSHQIAPLIAAYRDAGSGQTRLRKRGFGGVGGQETTIGADLDLAAQDTGGIAGHQRPRRNRLRHNGPGPHDRAVADLDPWQDQAATADKAVRPDTCMKV